MPEHLLAQLQAMVLRDRMTRDRLVSEDRLYGSYAQEMQDVHVENAQALNEIIAEHGWPGISLVGIEGSRAAWLIAQHSICTPDLQRGFLRLLTEAAEAGEATRKQVAFLTDRIHFNEGRPQVYGTVLDWNEQGELGCALEDPDAIDSRRSAVGLPPFEQSLHEQREAVKDEGGAPPDDYASYKRSATEWARSVGWI